MLLTGASSAHAVETLPVPVTGNVRFSNTAPGFAALLGLRQIAVAGVSLSPYRTSSSDQPSSGVTDTDYEIRLDAEGAPAAGIDYQLSYRLNLAGPAGAPVNARYQFSASPHVALHPGPTLHVTGVVECAGILHIRFINAGGAPVAVQGATISALLPGGVPQAETILPALAREADFVVIGGSNLQVNATVITGAGDSTLHFSLATNVLSVCDGVVPIDFVVPSAGALGTIHGDFDMVGETEALWGDAGIGDPANSWMVATGPAQNVRTYTLPLRSVVGSPAESSGRYTLPNLPPATFTSPPTPYTLQGTMGILRFRRFEYFATPTLGVGQNPAPDVQPGLALDLGSTFVMNPGFIGGTITLSGPRESAASAYRSPLRGLSFSADGSSDGLPSRSIYGNFGSMLIARGVDVQAKGARYSAAGGIGETSFDGAYDPADGAWNGDYELALGGLDGEPSVWRADSLALRMFSGAPSDPANYVDEGISLTDHRITDREVSPGVHTRVDRDYRFGQVCIRFRSTGAPIWNPRFWLYSSGEGPGYTVDGVGATGTPNTPESASAQGTLVALLPEGHYHLVPFVSTVSPGSVSGDYIQLDPLDLDVLPLQQLCVTPCLRVDFALPACSGSPQFAIKTAVRTLCDNQVKRLTYRIDDGPEIEICSACGSNPSREFGLVLPGVGCHEHDITVTAMDSNGEVASNTQHIRVDSEPPSISCPKDLVVGCMSAAGTVVEYPAPIVTDNCPGVIRVACDPPSGSLFPPGLTIVRCVATDACGNSSECKFTVTVTPDCTSTGCTLTCPKDIVVDCTGSKGTAVTFPQPELSGDCQKGTTVVCEPPSGSLFPIGETIVRCNAIDSTGKQVAECKFVVSVRASVSIEPAICVRWTCGTLRSAPTLDGPWTEVPGASSPYYATSREALRYYRVQ